LNNTKTAETRQRAIANGYLIVQTLLWGLSFIWTKNINAEMPTIAYLALRFIAAALAVLPLLLLRIKGALTPSFIRASLVLGGLLFLAMTLQIFGLNHTSVTNSSFITSTTVIIVPILERVLFKRKLSPALWAGSVVAFIGVTVLSGGLSVPNIGDVLTALCAVTFSFHILFSAKYAAQHPADALGCTQIVVTAVLFTVLWSADGFNLAGFHPSLLVGIAIMGVVSTATGFAGQVIALKYTRPTLASLIYALEPIFATMFALFVPGVDGSVEVITLRTGLGVLAVLAGVVVALVDAFLPRRRAAAAAAEAEADAAD
jgi:drug/metabolite transporter (DMT)-like permease